MRKCLLFLLLLPFSDGFELFANAPLSYSPRVLFNTDLVKHPEPFNEPPRIASNNGELLANLGVGVASINASIFAWSCRAFCYEGRCTVPGPSLYVKPGDRVRIVVTNLLNNDDGMLANYTNLVLRGLHLPDKETGLQLVAARHGDAISLSFTVPLDQAPGVHWYHSFVNGVEALHLMGGLFGAFVVELPPSEMPAELNAMARKLLVFSHINLNDRVYNPAAPTLQSLSAKAGSKFDCAVKVAALEHSSAGRTSTSRKSVSDAWLTNGLYQPRFSIYAEEWQILDILVVSAYRMIELELRDSIGFDSGNLACDIRLLAIDGVYLPTPRTGSAVRHLPLLPGSRATVAVMCNTPGTYFLQSAAVVDDGRNDLPEYSRIGNTYTKSTQNLATIVATEPFSITWLPPPENLQISRPSYLSDLSHSQPSISWSISTENSGCCRDTDHTHWIGLGVDCRLQCWDNVDCTRRYSENYNVLETPSVLTGHCNYSSYVEELGSFESDAISFGKKIMPTISWRAAANETQEITIWSRNATTSQLRFFSRPVQIVSYSNLNLSSGNETAGDFRGIGPEDVHFYFKIGDWRDVLPGFVGKLVVRTVFTLEGLQLFGSSLLQQSDGGMLAVVDVGRAPADVHMPPDVSVSKYAERKSTSEGELWKLNESLCDSDGRNSYYSESVDVRASTRLVVINSCPDHFSRCQEDRCGGNSSFARVSVREIRLPLFPVLSAKWTDTTCTTEAVGVALSGATIRGSSDGKTSVCLRPTGSEQQAFSGRTGCDLSGDEDGVLYCGDILSTSYSKSIDKCGGLADSRAGVYSYVVPPSCLILSKRTKNPFTHDPHIGWAMDGFPIYGPIGPHGIAMRRCNSTGSHPFFCLDSCNGFLGELPGVDAYMYRYYVTGPTGSGKCSGFIGGAGKCSRIEDACCVEGIPSPAFYPYTIGCFRGCSIDDPSCLKTSSPGTTLLFSPGGSNFFVNNSEISNETACLTETLEVSPKVPMETPEMQAARSAFMRRKQTTARRTVIRHRHNNTLSIIHSKSSPPVDELSTPNIEVLPSSTDDSFITGVVFDPENSGIFYTEPSGVFSQLSGQSSGDRIVSGTTFVQINGHNFGSNEDDLISVLLNGVSCTSIILVSSERIDCIWTRSRRSEVSAEAVVVTTRGGVAAGPYAEPVSVVRSGSGRPVISSVVFDDTPFQPHAIALVAPSTGPGVVYVSNTATGGFSIMRCLRDGSQLELVETNVESVFGIAVVSGDDVGMEGSDVLIFVEANSGLLRRKLLPSLDPKRLFWHQHSQPALAVEKGLHLPVAVVADLSSGLVENAPWIRSKLWRKAVG